MWTRAAAVLVGGVLALGVNGVAFADPAPASGKTTTQQGLRVANAKSGRNIPGAPEAGLLSINIGDKGSLAYCIDILTGTAAGLTYGERKWTDAGVPNLDQIKWILHHGYPSVTPEALFQAAGASANGFGPKLAPTAYAATQAAIWSLSDSQYFELGAFNAKLDGEHDLGREQYTQLQTIVTYLLQNAKGEGQSDPAPHLTISPASKGGEVGKKIGPFTVVSGGGNADLAVTGGVLLDQDGNPITKPLPNGGQFWVRADHPGDVTVDATGSGSVPTGRVFMFTGTEKKQKLILAGVAGTKLSARATITVTAAPVSPSTPATPGLPVTGFGATTAVFVGLVLIGGGAVLVAAIRRRRIRFTA